MKQIVFALLFTLLNCAAFAQWTLDKNHSKFTFIALHHGISELDGYFKKFDGKITAAKDDLSDAAFEISIETASLNTDLEMRDNHLKNEDMFNVVNFPLMTFKSTAFKKISGSLSYVSPFIHTGSIGELQLKYMAACFNINTYR